MARLDLAPAAGMLAPTFMGISPQQFEALQQRLRQPRRKARTEPESESPFRSMAPTAPPVVLGIDPSLRGTGWGIIRADRNAPALLGAGTLRCAASWPRSRCLVRIAAGLRDAIREHQPTTCAVEALFFAQNLQTALLMGEARGVCLLAAAEAGIDICEIAPRKVKQAVVGFGGAQKSAVARMVQRMLGLAEAPEPDAADALALALVHAQTLGRPTLEPVRRL